MEPGDFMLPGIGCVILAGWLFGGACGAVVAFLLRMFGGTFEETERAFKEGSDL